MSTDLGRGQDRTEQKSRALRRFELRATLLMVGVFLAAVPFTGLLLLVRRRWGPLESLDNGAADRLHAWVITSPTTVDVLQLITDVGGPGPMRLLAIAMAVALIVARRRRLAAYVVTTVAVAAVLSVSLKSLVGRARPIFDDAVSRAAGASFPSGHALTSFVVIGLVLLVGLPHLARRRWPIAISAGVVVVVAVGFTRIALGVHYVSDVVGGWVIGAAWLAAVTSAFHVWQQETPNDPQDDELLSG